MPSANISNLGVTAQFAPQIKRATATLSDGSAVMMVPDSNIAALAGDDTTGTMKIRFYKSNAARTTWSLNFTFTPSPAGSSATKTFVGSMVVGSDDRIGLVWQGTDNGLYFQVFTYSAGVYSASGTTQTIAAANAVTNRYRAIDVDYAGNANPAVIVYESKASGGPSAWTRVYIRNADGTTWRKAYEYDHATGAGGSIPIYTNSEDVSISWNAAGISSNVGQLLIYYTRTGFWFDHGDIVTELSYNVSTGTDNSATVVGSWPKFNQDIGAGLRRGWIFKTTNNLWQVAFSVGATRPVFQVMRLSHNAFSAPHVDQTVAASGYRISNEGTAVLRPLPGLPQIDYSINPYNAVGCVYADNRVMFGFLTSTHSVPRPIGDGSMASYGLASVVFRYNDAAVQVASYKDSQMRELDNAFTYGDRPIAVYGGGNNRNQAGDLKFNWLGFYGYAGNTASSAKMNKARAIIDTFYDPPSNVGPTLVVPNDTPTLQVRVQNSAFYPNVRGKIEWNLARDAAFTSDSRTITEPDANYRFFGSTTAQVPPPYNISLKLNGAGPQLLYSGTWYMRARVVSDLGQVSGWSATTTFAVSHPPAALGTSPAVASVATFGVTGAVAFSWTRTDTEPRDTQTAYRLVVTRLDTGTNVLDTGKVLSNLGTATQTLSSALKDVPLQWTVSLWDSDDVQGAFSNPVPFTLSDPPAVRVTSPVTAATVTSGVPIVTWAGTLSGGRAQKAFRVSAFLPVRYDVFGRTVSNGLGAPTSDGTATYILDGGATSEYSVGSGVAQLSNTSVNVSRKALLPSAMLNSDQVIDLTTTDIASISGTGGARFGLIARYVDASNYVFGVLQLDVGGTITAMIVKRVGGTNTTISSATLTGASWTSGTWWRARLKVVGDNVYFKTYIAGNQQPGYWQVSGSMGGQLVEPGLNGMYATLVTGNTNTLPVVARFDNYYSYDSNNAASVATSNWIQDTTATSYTFPSKVYSNNGFYMLRVEVMDALGMSGEDTSAFNTSWTAPVDGTFTLTPDQYGITVDWTNAGLDTDFISWRVYRRYMTTEISDIDDELSEITWVLLYETSAVQTSYSYKDYLAPVNKSADYVVVQVVERFGDLIESPISSFQSATSTGDRYYFIPTVPIGTIAAYEATNVTNDSFTDEVETETIHIIGRGRQVQVGDELGVSGTLQIRLRNPQTARRDRQFLQYLASPHVFGVWMKTPFGDVRCVKFMAPQVTLLAATGTTEMSDLSIQYIEIATDEPVTRL